MPEAKFAAFTRRLSESDAIDIWIARWLRIRPKDIIARYGCDPRRIYEVWATEKFPQAKDKAWQRFKSEHPGLIDRVDPGAHQVHGRSAHPDQLGLFD